MAILSTCSPERFPSKIDLEACGGFAWWYCDLVDAQGDGAVLIWFFGLPFLPGYEGGRERPRAHPGLNVALYRGGVPTFYLLEEQPTADLVLDEACWRWRFGASTLELRFDADLVRVEGALELAIPGSPHATQVALEVAGPRSRVSTSDGDLRHVWCPLAPTAEGRLEVREHDGDSWHLQGRAYVDANASAVPLRDLGMRSWRWGRLAFPDRELVFYEVDRAEDGVVEPLVLSIPKGAPERRGTTPITWNGPRRSVYGLSWDARATLVEPDGREIELSACHLIEDGPFYLRFALEATCTETGERARGFGEQVAVERIDRPWQRPFVRMRRRLADGDNSMWLPLFSGPRRGRVERLVRHWLGGTGASP